MNPMIRKTGYIMHLLLSQIFEPVKCNNSPMSVHEYPRIGSYVTHSILIILYMMKQKTNSSFYYTNHPRSLVNSNCNLLYKNRTRHLWPSVFLLSTHSRPCFERKIVQTDICHVVSAFVSRNSLDLPVLDRLYVETALWIAWTRRSTYYNNNNIVLVESLSMQI